ncbi:outer membrane autotransporter protein [Burkholderia pyrrocinia]|uniref:Outer membrane autotransporter protein n=1 Tax=Burkholderia pyrrocinia TaxID=60550 RepID=A0A318HYZ3_BURPY|nr:outer membrane autotransporter protein [Burkholderia pyrrocinia]SFW87818.1 outer membrane autotransporter barrel domain-containing protein [Burkholderia sp. NFACC33-1]SFY46060.1 outer membrane autotransporter barrel domain-containing protein [Burkholderia sp. NFPP32]
MSIPRFARLAFVHLNNHRMTESGGAAALQVEGGNNDAMFLTLGLRGTTQLDLGARMRLTLRGSAGWQHALAVVDGLKGFPEAISRGRGARGRGSGRPNLHQR